MFYNWEMTIHERLNDKDVQWKDIQVIVQPLAMCKNEQFCQLNIFPLKKNTTSIFFGSTLAIIIIYWPIGVSPLLIQNVLLWFIKKYWTFSLHECAVLYLLRNSNHHTYIIFFSVFFLQTDFKISSDFSGELYKTAFTIRSQCLIIHIFSR